MENNQSKRTADDTATRDKVRDVARDAVVSVADEVHAMRKSVEKTAGDLGKKWDETKPHQEKIKEGIADAAHAVEAAGEGVVDGIKDGFEQTRSALDVGPDK